MPKSVSIPLLLSLVFTFFVAILDHRQMKALAIMTQAEGSTGQVLPNRDLLLSAFSQCFTFTTIVALFVILFKSEKTKVAQFGKAIRDNISTIIVALAMSALFGAIELFTIVSKLLF